MAWLEHLYKKNQEFLAMKEKGMTMKRSNNCSSRMTGLCFCVFLSWSKKVTFFSFSRILKKKVRLMKTTLSLTLIIVDCATYKFVNGYNNIDGLSFILHLLVWFPFCH